MRKSASPWLGRSSLAALLVRAARRVREIFAETAYAQRRMVELRMSADSYAFDPDTAPDTYAEFLFRTSGHLQHERSARARTGR
jgi:hypothetical protein